MKINIKNNFGSIVNSKGITIINDRVVNEKENKNSKLKVFNEKISEDANKVDKIVINSAFVDINVSLSNSSKVETHCYGYVDIDKDINFDVKLVNRELIIKVEYSGNCWNPDLRLDINVPFQKTFKLIYVNTMSGDIFLNEKVSTENLKIKTQSGNLETVYANLKNVSIETMSGKVKFIIKATTDIDVDINTISGEVNAQLHNISQIINISTNSMSGHIINRYRESSDGYTANIKISTMSGDIRIS